MERLGGVGGSGLSISMYIASSSGISETGSGILFHGRGATMFFLKWLLDGWWLPSVWLPSEIHHTMVILWAVITVIFRALVAAIRK